VKGKTMTTFSMRRVLVASGLILGSTFLFASNAKAADPQPAGGGIGGGVAPVSLLTYTAPAGVTLNPSGGNTDMAFGSVWLQNNSYAGWTLTVKSTNGSKLSNATYGNVAYTGLSATSTSSRLGSSANIDVSTANTAVNVYNPIAGALYDTNTGKLDCGDSTGCTITFTADIADSAINGKPAGDYAETLTFTLTSKQ